MIEMAPFVANTLSESCNIEGNPEKDSTRLRELKNDFSKFIRERDKKKRSVYSYVIFSGYVLIVLTLAVYYAQYLTVISIENNVRNVLVQQAFLLFV